jgi:glycosyltransferase involved in cell wall biosynthesis
MRVLHLSTSDRLGGAAIAAYRQHQALRSAGIESRMLVKTRVTDDPEVQSFQAPIGFHYRLPRVLRRYYLKAVLRQPIAWQPFSDDRSEYGGSETERLPPHEVINFHWTAGFVDQPSFFRRLAPNTPVVITMHDMNPFTGGCHYDMGCGRFIEKCGRCPQLESAADGDFSRKIWSRKFRAYESWSSRRIRFVADSHWLARQASSSSLLRRFPISTIHYGVDTKIFRPFDRAFARQALGIPAESRVVMFAADSVENERKGGRYLAEALAQIKLPLFLVTAGGGHLPAGHPRQTLHLGNVDCEHVMALAYNTADVFVIPSIHEAFGQTALEAAACGIPVVGFDTGGIPDIVLHGKTGILCPVKDAQALREAIELLLINDDMRKAMGTRAGDYVEQEFTFPIQAGKYNELYSELLNC